MGCMNSHQLAEGQRVFAYVVVDVINPAREAEPVLGKIIVEARGKGTSTEILRCNPESDTHTIWHAAKAGRGFVRNGQVAWDQSTLAEIDRIKNAMTSQPVGETVFVG